MDIESNIIETHPFPPFINHDTRLLIMGTFPPQPKRWSMEFYYPNRTNDFWYIMGLIFFGDRTALLEHGKKTFDLDRIKRFLTDEKIGLSDTGFKVRRLQGNASDKFLEILEPVPLENILRNYPNITTLCTTGEKAAGVIAELTDTGLPKMGEMLHTDSGIEIWRMPSTSRAYPMKLEKKAEYYATMFRHAGILS